MLAIETSQEPTIRGVVVHMTGSAVVDDADNLQKALDAVAAEHPLNVVLDLHDLAIITSTCISKLVNFRKAIIARGSDSPVHGRVVMAAAKDGVSRSMRFTRLDELFEMFPTVEAAVAALRQ